MITADKDLEALRKEHKDVSDYATKIAILSLTILIILSVSFSRACKKVNGEEVKTSLCQIDKIIENTKGARDVSYVFDLFPNDNETCALNCPSPSPAPLMSPSPFVTVAGQPPPSAVNSSTPMTNEILAHAQQLEREHELECKKSIENKLEESAQEWFGVKAPIPGVDITIDLRYWIFGFPILFFVSGIYLHILRKKISMLRILGSYRLQAGSYDVTQVDRLLFGNDSSQMETPFTKFPASLEALLFISCYLFLPVYLIYVGAPFWRYWDTSSTIGIALVLLTLTYYAIAYAHFATQRLDHQLVALTQQDPQRNLINTMLDRSKCIINWLRIVIPHKVTLSAGGLLIILTLFLTMTQESCGKTKHNGLDIVRGAQGATWFTADTIFGVNSAYNNIARVVYIISICLAVITIIVALIRGIQRGRIALFLSTITFMIFLFSVIDFSLNVPLFSNWFIPVKLLFWLVPIFLWLRYSLFARNPERWLGIRSVLLTLYTPILVLAYLVVGQRVDLPGLVIFLSGLSLLKLGYMQMARRKIVS